MSEHQPYAPTDGASVGAEVQEAVTRRVATARRLLAATIERREAEVVRLVESGDPDDALVARAFHDFLLQADEMRRNGSALVVATGPDGDLVVGRMAVLDEDKDVVLVPWHAPVGQQYLLAPDRLLATEHPDGSVTLHRLTADDTALATTIRSRMRAAAMREEMSDPLATLTAEQGRALARITRAPGDVVLTGPPGSGKSAIVMVELARRILSAQRVPLGRVLFVTGTARLARRAEALTRLLGTGSVTPVPQPEVLAFLGVTDADTPAADTSDGRLALPRAIEDAFATRRDRLASTAPVAHPLGRVPADEIDAVALVRARAATQSYRDSSRALAAALTDEYQQLVPGESSRAAALEASTALRPTTTPTELVREAAGGRSLSRALKAAATAYARWLLDGAPRADRADWDLVVVDEYQRLPDIVLALLRHRSDTLLLSGDPLQSFAGADAASRLAAATPVGLETSLRLPAAIAAWIDDFWHAHGQRPPSIRSAVQGGEVRSSRSIPDDPDAAVIASRSRSPDRRATREWLDPADAVGLEWPHVVLVDPEAIWRKQGPAGVFIAASRAIDRLTVVA